LPTPNPARQDYLGRKPSPVERKRMVQPRAEHWSRHAASLLRAKHENGIGRLGLVAPRANHQRPEDRACPGKCGGEDSDDRYHPPLLSGHASGTFRCTGM
jgi:hypothetical protein